MGMEKPWNVAQAAAESECQLQFSLNCFVWLVADTPDSSDDNCAQT